MNLRNTATDYAVNRQWAIFPVHGIVDGRCTCGNAECKSPGKHPATANGLKAATKDSRGFGMLFKDDYNIAVATGEASGFWALDIDGQAGEASLSALEAEHGPLPSTLTHYTGNGKHLFFRWPGYSIKTTSKRLGTAKHDGLDVRGDGGYVVVAPSRHASGVQYRFADKDTPIADAPDWLLALVKKDQPTPAATAYHPEPDRDLSADDVRSMLSYIHPDCDYQTWVEIGMGLHAGGWPVQVWDDWSRGGAKYQNGDCHKRWKGFKPGHGVTMGSVWHHAEANGWTPALLTPAQQGPHPAASFLASIRKAPAQLKDNPATLNCPPPPQSVGQFPFDPLSLTGTIGETVRWICGSAIKPQPELALMNTLAAMGAVFGRRYATEWDTRTNIYIVGLAPTGSGKDHSRKQIKKLLHAAYLDDFYAGDSIVSAPGMLRGVEKHPAQILLLDEIGMLLRAITDERSPSHFRLVSKALTELFSSSNSVFHGGNYASADVNPIIIDHPSLCVYGTSTLEKYTEALSRSAIASGELNRFLVLKGRDGKRQDRPQGHQPSERLVAEWNAYRTQIAEGQGNLQGAVSGPHIEAPKPIIVKWDDVYDRILALGHKEDRLAHDAEREGARGVWTRYLEQTIKLAMIFAIARNPVAPMIENSDLDFGETLVEASGNFVMRLARENIADSQAERDVNEVARVLRDHGDWMSRTALSNRLRSIKKKDRDALIADLAEQEVIEVAEDTTGRGRKTVKYRYVGG